MTRQLKPPDGGFGWVIVCASALSHFCVIPLMLNSGLIFKPLFDNLGFSHQDSSVIINTNAAFGMATGVLNGALLKFFGYRKSAALAGVCVVAGVAITAFVNSFWEYFIYYGCLTSFGMGTIVASYSLALNTYFFERRNVAVSLATTMTGLGTIIMPQVMSFLMVDYAPQGVILIMAGVCTHTILAAMLLQPVKRHMKEVDDDVEKLEALISDDEPIKRKISKAESENGGFHPKMEPIRESPRKNSIMESTMSINAGPIYGIDAVFAGSVISLNTGVHANSQMRNNLEKIPSSQEITAESNDSKPKSFVRRILLNLANFLDLSLLRDLTYLNIMTGMSMAIFAELSFSTLTPFILADKGLTLKENAICISTMSFSDFVFRFLAPYVAKFISDEPRILYMFSLILLIITRFILIFCTSYWHILWVALALGVARGLRTVYMNLVIPAYVPIEKLANANGLQMMVNGIIVMMGAPLLGFIRDVTGSYNMCIFIMNCVTFSCTITWTSEIVYSRWKVKRESNCERK